MPVGVPHIVWQGPFIPLVFAWFFSLRKRLLEAFLDEYLAYFSKRNAKAFLREDCIELSCSAFVGFPLLNDKVIEFRI